MTGLRIKVWPERRRWCRAGRGGRAGSCPGDILNASLQLAEPLGKREEASSTTPCSKPGLPDPLEH